MDLRKSISRDGSGASQAIYPARQTSFVTGYTVSGRKKARGKLSRAAPGVSFDQAQLDLLASILSFTSQALPPHLLSLYFRTLSSASGQSKWGSHKLWEDGARRCVASSDAWVEVWVEMMKYLGEDGSLLDKDLVHVIESKVGDSIALMPISKKVGSL
jgi:hypothetical protein